MYAKCDIDYKETCTTNQDTKTIIGDKRLFKVHVYAAGINMVTVCVLSPYTNIEWWRSFQQ